MFSSWSRASAITEKDRDFFTSMPTPLILREELEKKLLSIFFSNANRYQFYINLSKGTFSATIMLTFLKAKTCGLGVRC